MIKSLITAFSTYSKIPMPKTEWTEESMRYSLCFFPLVGVVIAFVNILCLHTADFLRFNNTMKAVLLTVIPILISGGIHFDGFLDTVDALSSWQSTEKRLEIMKDPNTGAFAVIYAVVYVLAQFGLYTVALDNAEILGFVPFIYVYSRILSGIGAVVLKKAKKDGMLAATAQAQRKNVKYILFAELALCTACIILKGGLTGIVVFVTALLAFFYYKAMSEKYFGGVTGDTAGFFLQVTEIFLLAVITVYCSL